MVYLNIEYFGGVLKKYSQKWFKWKRLTIKTCKQKRNLKEKSITNRSIHLIDTRELQLNRPSNKSLLPCFLVYMSDFSLISFPHCLLTNPSHFHWDKWKETCFSNHFVASSVTFCSIIRNQSTIRCIEMTRRFCQSDDN